MHAYVNPAAFLASMMLALNCTPASARETPPLNAAAPVPKKVTVQVLGRVKKPGEIVLDSGARLSDALTAAGAFAIEALVARVGGTPIPDTECTPGGSRLRYVFLTRTVDSSPRSSYAIEFAAVRQHDPRYDMLLLPNDRIVVPECRPTSGFIRLPPTFPQPFAGS